MAVRMSMVLQTAGLVFECVPCFFRLLIQRSTSRGFLLFIAYFHPNAFFLGCSLVIVIFF